MGTNDQFSRGDEIPLYQVDGCAAFGAGEQTCRWKCGSQCAHAAPNTSDNDSFRAVVGRYVSRRSLLIGAVAATAGMVAAPVLERSEARAQSGGGLAYQSLPLGNEDTIQVPPGYAQTVLLRWGDRLFDDAPAWDIRWQSRFSQERQFGYNNDFLGFLPLPIGASGTDRALLVVNHEYTNPELMFYSYNPEAPTLQQVEVELAAHGLTIVELVKSGGAWAPVVGGAMNRRITGETPMLLTGPAAGSAWLRTREDPSGTMVRGTLNNCSAGITPWGTVLTAEENFNQYFANAGKLPESDPRRGVHSRYGLTANASERKWERYYQRFDIAQEPNEPYRFGWMVEIDPYDPSSMPKKRTALGRLKHEAATFLVGPTGRVGVFMGDDERFDYFYKFVTAGSYNANDRAANMNLLDSGTLYVAKFNDDGTGTWIPLVAGQGALTAERGFATQADVLVKTRLAADAVGATKMDRPEDAEINPLTKKLYLALTNNTQRTAAQVDKANPRASNRDGHIIEMAETNNDPASLTFTWSVFMLCGEPESESTYFAGFDKSQVTAISSPDNLIFDNVGNLWIFTDGQTGTLRRNDSVYSVPTEGPERGHLKRFFNAVPGSETASGILSIDNEALFVSIQHPGEGGTLERPVSTWPDRTNVPRPGVVMVTKSGGGSRVIGS